MSIRRAQKRVQVIVRDVEDIDVEPTKSALRESDVDARCRCSYNLIHVSKDRSGWTVSYLDSEGCQALRHAARVRHDSILGFRWGVAMREVFVQPSGQDDNLGDSALRQALLQAVRSDGVRLNVHLDGQTSDYLAGLPLTADDLFYPRRADWLEAARKSSRPVLVLNAGEINLQRKRRFPQAERAAEMREILSQGGAVIAAGLGLRRPPLDGTPVVERVLREARVLSWRDEGSRRAAGCGQVAPDWAFALGPQPSDWRPQDERRFIAVTLRFDRPWPGAEWLRNVRSLAKRTNTSVVTVAQVARDAPRAVQLADALGGHYAMSPSTRHDELDRHVRSVYADSHIVISDRAHALIIGATEGARPLGTASDPQKIERILDAAGLAALTGHHDALAERAARSEQMSGALVSAIEGSRSRLGRLAAQMRTIIAGSA